MHWRLTWSPSSTPFHLGFKHRDRTKRSWQIEEQTDEMVQGPSRISALSATIAENTAIIDKYLRDNHIAEPSFDNDQAGFDATLPPAIEKARNALREATLELHELTMGPRTYMQELIFKDSSCFIDVIYRFRIAQRVPLDQPTGISYASLAEDIGVDKSSLQHILRFAVANRVFTEPSTGMIAHNANSRAIVRESELVDWMGVASQDVLPMLKKLGGALEQFPAADEPTEAAGSVTDPSDTERRLSFYRNLAREPERSRRFAGGMTFHNKGESYGMHHLLASFDWAALPAHATVVDLGGSQGEAALAVTERFPHLHFVVQDLPDTIKTAPQPPADRNITLMPHDFFQPQPIAGAAVYYFRWILHNWPDKYCVRLLRALIPALTPGARVLVIDDVLPPFGTSGAFVERRLRMLDTTMMALGNAKEREEAEFRALFAEADPRFRYVGLTKPPGSDIAVMETVWDP